MYEFRDALTDFSPNLIVVSGIQMLDNFPFKTGEYDWLKHGCLKLIIPSSKVDFFVIIDWRSVHTPLTL